MSVAPISQEIRLPTNSEEVGAAVKKMDELIARVAKLEKAGENQHQASKKHLGESESGLKNFLGTMGRVVRGELEMAAGFRAIGLAAHEARAGTSEFLEFIGAEAALELLKEIGEKVIEIGEEAIRSAAKAQRMNRIIDIAAGGHGAGENMRHWIEANAKAGEMTEAQNESAYVALKRVGIGQQPAALMMKAAEDVAAVSEHKDEAYNEAINAFSRIQVMGRVQARSLMPLGIGVNDLKTLDRYKNFNLKQLNKVLESGSFDQNDMFKLIMSRAHETKLGQRAVENADLLSTKMTKLAELPDLFYKRLGETSAATRLASEIGKVIGALDPESANGKRIFGGLESALDGVADAFDEIDWNDVASGVAKVSSEIGPAIALFKELSHDIKAVYDAWESLPELFHSDRGIAKVLGDRIAKREGLGEAPITDRLKGFDYQAARAKIHAMGGAQPAMEGPVYIPPELNSLNAGAYGTGAALADGYAKGIEAGAAKGEDAAARMGERSHHALKKSIKAQSPSRLAMETGGDFGDGYAIGVERSADRISDAMESTISVPAAQYDVPSAAGGPLGGSLTVDVDIAGIFIDGTGKSADEVGRMVRDELSRSLASVLVDALAQRRAEGT